MSFIAVLFSGDILKFTFKGCRIEFSFLFVLVLCFFAMMNCKALVYIIIFSSLHELGHLLCLLLCGGRPTSLSFSYYGFALKYDDVLSRGRETLVLLSGCAVNLLLYLIFKDEYNLILFLLNSLPIYPLDVGRVVRLYFPELSRLLSVALIALITALSIYLLIFYKSATLILIALYLIVYSVNQ